MYSLKVVGAGLYQVTSAWRQRRCCHGGVPASVLMEHSMVTEEERAAFGGRRAPRHCCQCRGMVGDGPEALTQRSHLSALPISCRASTHVRHPHLARGVLRPESPTNQIAPRMPLACLFLPQELILWTLLIRDYRKG